MADFALGVSWLESAVLLMLAVVVGSFVITLGRCALLVRRIRPQRLLFGKVRSPDAA